MLSVLLVNVAHAVQGDVSDRGALLAVLSVRRPDLGDEGGVGERGRGLEDVSEGQRGEALERLWCTDWETSLVEI